MVRNVAVLAVALGALTLGTVYAGGNLPLLNGDVDCSNAVDPTDSLKILRFDAGLSYTQGPNCAPIGGEAGNNPGGGVGFSRDNPVPAGQSFVVPEGFRVEIIQFIPNATQMVLDQNQFNDPPAPGKKFAIVRLKLTNVSAGNPADAYYDLATWVRLVGSANVGYEDTCGVIPDDLLFLPTELFVGGSVEGNVCFEVGQQETGFVLYTDTVFADDEDTRWFAVE